MRPPPAPQQNVFLPRLLHLGDRHARGAQHVPWRGDDAVVAGQVARVVDGDAARPVVAGRRARRPRDRREPPGRDEPGEERRVVDDLVVPAQLAVLVADRVEAVRAGGHDRPLAHPVAVERLDVARRRASGRRSRCPSAAPDRRCTTPPGRGPRSGRPPRARHVATARATFWLRVVERRRAADPVQDVELVEPPVRRHRRRRSGPRTAAAFVQSSRADGGWPHGLPWLSIARKALGQLAAGSGSPRGRGSGAARRSCRRAR